MNWFLEMGIPLLGTLLALFLPIYLVLIVVRSKREAKKSLARLEESTAAEEPPLCEVHGRITEKHCYSDLVGTKNVHSYTCFYFLFLTDDGETLRYEIDAETYLAIEENAEGTVGIVGDQFYGFCSD